MIEQNKNKKKRKLKLNTIGLILLVVIVAANIYVWRNNTAGKIEAATLNGNITAVRQQITAVTEPASDLESQLETLQTKLAAAQTGFPGTVDRNEVIDYILDTAKQYQVQVLPLVSDGWGVENIGQAYNVLSITATAEGSLKDVKSLIAALQTGPYPTLTISDCVVDRVSLTTLEAPGDDLQVSVKMKIGIYTFTPAPEKDAAE